MLRPFGPLFSCLNSIGIFTCPSNCLKSVDIWLNIRHEISQLFLFVGRFRDGYSVWCIRSSYTNPGFKKSTVEILTQIFSPFPFPPYLAISFIQLRKYKDMLHTPIYTVDFDVFLSEEVLKNCALCVTNSPNCLPQIWVFLHLHWLLLNKSLFIQWINEIVTNYLKREFLALKSFN